MSPGLIDVDRELRLVCIVGFLSRGTRTHKTSQFVASDAAKS